MQFHLNGYEPGDPEIFDLAERSDTSGASGPLPEEVDVLIVGCGPAGLTLAAQLSAFPEIRTCIVELCKDEASIIPYVADGADPLARMARLKSSVFVSLPQRNKEQ